MDVHSGGESGDTLGDIVAGVFALVLALKLVPAIKPHYLTDIPSVKTGQKYWEKQGIGCRSCAELP